MNMWKIIYILSVFLGFVPSINAAGVKATATGIGYVVQGDVASAKDRAVADAKIRVIELVCGTQIDSRTVIHKTLLIDSTVMTRSRGTVKAYEVVDESYDEKHQLYSVTIDAVVDQETMDRDVLKKNILFMREKSQEKDAGLTRELAGEFSRAGASITQVFADKSEFDIIGSGTAAAILKNAEKDILVVYKMDIKSIECLTDNFCAAGVKGFIQLYAPFKGPGADVLMVDESFDNTKGFGNTKQSATDKALTQLKKKLIHAFMGRLEKSLERVVKVEVINIPDFDTYKNIKRTIETFRWVINVKEDSVGYHPNKSVFLVWYKNDLDFLSQMLDKIGKYRFNGRSMDVFTLEYNGHGPS